VIAVSWQALGTSATLAVSEDRCIEMARAIVEEELDRIDRACSRFRADSELSRLNARAGSWARVAPLLMEAVELALRAAQITDGDVDPTVGRALERAGYDRDFSLLPPLASGHGGQPGTVRVARSLHDLRGSQHATARSTSRVLVRIGARTGWREVELDRRHSAIRVPRGIKLDLGATAKAWAADRAARAARAGSGCGVLVSLGGDISTCGPPPAGGWRVYVTDDHRAGASAPGQRVTVHSGGLATSSVTARRWAHGGRAVHHIIDPASGEPARGPWRTVSVAAIDCADANIASTAALVRGEQARAWLEGLGVPARLVDHAGSVCTVGEWPAESAPASTPQTSGLAEGSESSVAKPPTLGRAAA
jgi:FAD:protein FMN transferase